MKIQKHLKEKHKNQSSGKVGKSNIFLRLETNFGNFSSNF